MKRHCNYKLMLILSIIGNFFLYANGYAQMSDPIPDGWTSTDIGEPALPSKVFYNSDSDMYQISAGGYDTWNAADECRFIYFETEEDKEVVVRILGLTFTGWNSKGFIMIRSSLEPEASMCFLEVTPHGNANRVFLSGRKKDATNAEIFGMKEGIVPLFPRWIKFVRQGSYITGYHKDTSATAQWVRVATVKLALKGKAYLGIGVCGGGAGSGYATATFDKLAVRDIEIPYQVIAPVPDQKINEGKSNKLDVTGVFGHYIGDYWTIEPKSSDEGIATAVFSETKVAVIGDDGEEFKKYITINGIKDGITAIKLSTNISGFKMSNEFVVDVSGKSPVIDIITPMIAPSPWIFTDFTSQKIGKDPISWMEYDGDIYNKVKILTMESSLSGAEDSIALLYQNFSNDDSIQMSAYFDTVKNTGRGSFAGLMIRELFDSISGITPFVGFSIGSYEGIRFNYRWDDGVDVDAIDETVPVTLPCWLRLNKYKENGIDYIRTYYSYDGIFWKEHLKYPFLIRFFSNDIIGGLAVSGGKSVSSKRKEVIVVKNLKIAINQPFEPLKPIGDISKMIRTLEIYPNPITTTATINYNIIVPGWVKLTVYDSYGTIRDELVNEFENIGDYAFTFNPVNLRVSGIYLLRLESEQNYQFIRFIYVK